MPQNKVGIADIANALNISTMSVSRALSGKSGISESLREKIQVTAREMGYFKQKNETCLNILVLHQKPIIQDSSNYSAMIQGMEKALQDVSVEYSIEFVDKEKQENLFLPCKLSKNNRFDGVIFIGAFNEAYTDFIKPKVKNQVFYAGYSPACDSDSVSINFNNAGFKQCEHLIQNGHQAIRFIGDPAFFRNQERLLGITTAMQKYGIRVPDKLALCAEEDLEKFIPSLFQGPEAPTAIICQWDFTALKLLKQLSLLGISVPQDVAVIGSGNTEMSTLCQPSLTTMDLHIEYSCKIAVDLLLRKIADEDKPVENIGINATLVKRDSV